MDSRIYNVGIIGYGPNSAARTFHVPLIGYEPALKVKTISTLLPEETKAMVPNANVTTEPNDIFSDDEIDMVVVATPNIFHRDYAEKALQAGKHVVVEKPLAITSKEIAALIALAKQKDRILMQFHNRRWDGGFLTVQQLIKDGACGDIKLLEMNYDRWVPTVSEGWRDTAAAGSGVLYDLGLHLLDQTLALFGRPIAVQATIANQRPGATVDDYFVLNLAYPDHQVVLRATMLATEPAPRYRLVGTKANYVKYGIDRQALQLNEGILPNDPTWGRDDTKDYGLFNTGENEARPHPTERGAYQMFYHHLAGALAGKNNPPVDARDAHDVVALIEAAFRSNREKRTIGKADINYL